MELNTSIRVSSSVLLVVFGGARLFLFGLRRRLAGCRAMLGDDLVGLLAREAPLPEEVALVHQVLVVLCEHLHLELLLAEHRCRCDLRANELVNARI